jgi:hypothetical protein
MYVKNTRCITIISFVESELTRFKTCDENKLITGKGYVKFGIQIGHKYA